MKEGRCAVCDHAWLWHAHAAAAFTSSLRERERMSLEGESLRGRVAYVTGASSGIGAATALRLVEHGADVVLGARRLERLEDVAERCRAAAKEHDAGVIALSLDVNDEASVDQFLLEAGRRAGPCDVLVNNAGGARGTGRVVDAELSDWSWMIDTNATSLFRMTQKVVRQMQERGGGDVVMVASVAGLEPYPGGSVYCAVKAAVHAFAKALRQEVLGHNIRVVTLDPGLVETEFSLVRLGDPEKARKVYEGLTPLQADDVADCAVFAVTRPRHVCLDHLLVLATAQAGTRAIHRVPE